MNKISKYMMISASVLWLASCSFIPEPLDENKINEEYLDRNPNSAEGLLLTAYEIYNNLHFFRNGSSGYYLSVASDDAVTNQMSSQMAKLATGQQTPNFNPLASTRWNEPYRAITYVNKFIEKIDIVKWHNDDLINELFKRRLKGEALGLRAALHYEILECYAGPGADNVMYGVPYYDRFIANPEEYKDYPRLPFPDMVKKMNEDFEEAWKCLPYVYSDNPADIRDEDKVFDEKSYLLVNGGNYMHRLDGRSVRALQARLMLFAGSRSYQVSSELTGEYNRKAAEHANDVLKRNAYKMAPDGVEFYNGNNDLNNPEFIWRMSKPENEAFAEIANFPPSYNGNANINPSQNLVDAFYMSNGYPITSPEGHYNPANPYTNRDRRLGVLILYDKGGFKGKPQDLTDNHALNGINKVFGKSTRTGYYLKKLIRMDVNIPNSGSPTAQMHVNPFIRFTEMFLVLAEAENNLGGPDYKIDGSEKSARDILRMIRQRGMKLTKDPYLDGMADAESMMSLIQNERRIELSFEGFRYFDMRRWGLPLDETIKGCNPTDRKYEIFDVEQRPLSDPKYRYMPVPRNYIRKFGYVQNSGW